MKIDTQEMKAVAQPQGARLDIYAFIHKALRLAMTQTLAALGTTDPADDEEFARHLQQVVALAELCRDHVEHEDVHVHTALLARCPGACDQAVADHLEHRRHIDALIAAAQATAAKTGADRAPALHVLYHALALFVGDNFAHMHMEETRHNQALWSAYTDAELQALEGRIIASQTPAQLMQVMRWMIPAMAPAERTLVLSGMRAEAPPPAFAAVLDQVQPHLDATGWAKLSRGLGLPAVSGMAG